MRFKLDSKFTIVKDKYQWILQKDERPYQFFITLDHLLKSHFNAKISDSKASDVKQVIRAIKHAENAICSLSTKIEERFEEAKK